MSKVTPTFQHDVSTRPVTLRIRGEVEDVNPEFSVPQVGLRSQKKELVVQTNRLGDTLERFKSKEE